MGRGDLVLFPEAPCEVVGVRETYFGADLGDGKVRILQQVRRNLQPVFDKIFIGSHLGFLFEQTDKVRRTQAEVFCHLFNTEFGMIMTLNVIDRAVYRKAVSAGAKPAHGFTGYTNQPFIFIRDFFPVLALVDIVGAFTGDLVNQYCRNPAAF